MLEWVSNGDLERLLALGGGGGDELRWEEPLLRLATDIARGIEYLHSREPENQTDQPKQCIVHRDLKPSNVLITMFLRAKIADFGSSKAIGKSTETMVGTPVYAAPEIMR